MSSAGGLVNRKIPKGGEPGQILQIDEYNKLEFQAPGDVMSGEATEVSEVEDTDFFYTYDSEGNLQKVTHNNLKNVLATAFTVGGSHPLGDWPRLEIEQGFVLSEFPEVIECGGPASTVLISYDGGSYGD